MIKCTYRFQWKVKVKVVQSCPTLCNFMDYLVHGILQAKILEWVAFPFSRESSQHRDWTQVSCLAGGFFTSWARRAVFLFIIPCSVLWKGLQAVRTACSWLLVSKYHFPLRGTWRNSHSRSRAREVQGTWNILLCQQIRNC